MTVCAAHVRFRGQSGRSSIELIAIALWKFKVDNQRSHIKEFFLGHVPT
jgi:hypothetical protein